MVEKKIHGAQIVICDFLDLVIREVFGVDGHAMTLAIECVALIIYLAVETLNREVEKIALVKLHVKFIAGNLFVHKIISYEVLHLVDPMIDRNKDVIGRYKV